MWGESPKSCPKAGDLLRSRTLPKRLWSLSRVLQFQRCWRNWCWHSAVHSATPKPIARITSGFRWHSCRWRLTRPGTLSHITLEEPPVALMYLGRTNTGVRTLNLRFTPQPCFLGDWGVQTCFKYEFLILLGILESKGYLILVLWRSDTAGMWCNVVQATSKWSDDCLGHELRVSNWRSGQSGNGTSGEGQQLLGRTFKGCSQEGSDLNDEMCLDMALGKADL